MSLCVSVLFCFLFLLRGTFCVQQTYDRERDFGHYISVFIIPPSSSSLNGGVPIAPELLEKTIRSFIYLLPGPRIYLLGNQSSLRALASKYKRWSVRLEPWIDHDYLQRPLFSSSFARAMAATTTWSMLVNSDVTTIDLPALKKLLDAASTMPKSFLFVSPTTKLRNVPDVILKSRTSKSFYNHAKMYATPVPAGGGGSYLWNRGKSSVFFNGSLPPFPVKKADYDSWLAHAVLTTTSRLVVSAEEAVVSVNVGLPRKWGGEGTEEGSEKLQIPTDFAVRSLRKKRSSLEGDGVQCPSRSPMVPVPCKNSQGGICFQPISCPCPGPAPPPSQSWLCHVIAPKPRVSAIITSPQSVQPSGYRQVEELLALKAADLQVVTLVAITVRYVDMLMNFVCNLRRLGLPDPLVAALDQDSYHFAEAHGLAVYLERPSEDLQEKYKRLTRGKPLEARCTFGSNCFRLLTKLKSRAVLRILKLGFHVLWSDVDIFWFRDPLPEMWALGPGTFPVQCDEWNTTIPPNGIGFPHLAEHGTINSGLYFARAERRVIQAFEAIIEHAAERINQSEQPSFYQVLCGESQEFVKGVTECVWRNGLRTVFLDRWLHPNGRVFGLWYKRTMEACEVLGCATLHNNWVKGKDRKTDRFKKKGMWHWDEYTHLCMYDWYEGATGLLKGAA